jgi:phenylalanyl-tRNA synthetase alpha subunit
MKFPITRETLQAYNYASELSELRQEELQKRITIILENLCNEFKTNMKSNSEKKRFVWELNSNNIHKHIPNSKFNYNLDDYLPLLIDKLKEIFIGCDIIIDPLKTYLIIDWS